MSHNIPGSPDTRDKSRADIRAMQVGMETWLREPEEKAWVSSLEQSRQASQRKRNLMWTQRERKGSSRWREPHEQKPREKKWLDVSVTF